MPFGKKLTPEEKAAQKAEEDRKKAAQKAEEDRKKAAQKAKKDRKKAEKANKSQPQGQQDRKYSATSVSSQQSQPSPVIENTGLATWGAQGTTTFPSTIVESNLDHSPPYTHTRATRAQRSSQSVSPTGEVLPSKFQPTSVPKQSSPPNFSVNDEPPPIVDRSDSESSSQFPEIPVKSKVPLQSNYYTIEWCICTMTNS